jgi:hypothetical protein
MPASDLLRRPPPRPVARLPAWHEVDQDLKLMQERQKRWGLAHSYIEDLYERLADPAASESKTLAEHVRILERGLDEYPSSAAGRVVLARALLKHAWEARGTGVADTVTEEGWRLFQERAARAHRLLDEAISLGVQDGEAYVQLITVGFAEGLPREQVQAWVEAGIKLDPTYYSIYDAMAVYLLPRWMGEPGDIERFAADVVSRVPGDNGLEAYARIALSTQRYECGWGETLFRGGYDPKLLVRGAEVMLKRYPNWGTVAHFAALCSVVAQDHEAAKRIRPYVGAYHAEDKVWVWEHSLTSYLKWSGMAENPQGEESWVFAGVLGVPEMGIAFGNNPRHVWVAQQMGRSAVNLIDTQARDVKLSLPNPSQVVNGFVYDPGRQWVLISAWNGPFTGWTFWDLAGGLPPIQHETQEQCKGLAIHPQRPIVFWGEGKTVRSWKPGSGRRGTGYRTQRTRAQPANVVRRATAGREQLDLRYGKWDGQVSARNAKAGSAAEDFFRPFPEYSGHRRRRTDLGTRSRGRPTTVQAGEVLGRWHDLGNGPGRCSKLGRIVGRQKIAGPATAAGTW